MADGRRQPMRAAVTVCLSHWHLALCAVLPLGKTRSNVDTTPTPARAGPATNTAHIPCGPLHRMPKT